MFEKLEAGDRVHQDLLRRYALSKRTFAKAIIRLFLRFRAFHFCDGSRQSSPFGGEEASRESTKIWFCIVVNCIIKAFVEFKLLWIPREFDLIRA